MKFIYKKKSFEIEGTSENDWIYKCIVDKKNFYEHDLLKYIYKLKFFINSKGNTIIDIGANIGNHSIFFQSFVCNKLISIECNDSTIPILKNNLLKNISNYLIIEDAVGSENGAGIISMPDNSLDNIGMAKVVKVVTLNPSSIKIRTLDAIVTDVDNVYKNIGMIKIDVEGMELEVLKGANQILIQNKPHLFIEANEPSYFNKIKNYLSKYNYYPMSVWAKTPVYHFAYKPSITLKYYVKYLTKNTKNEIKY